MTQEELSTFKQQLFRLCQTYGVLVSRHGEVRKQLKTREFFYEVEISAKVICEEGEFLMENKRSY